MGLGKKVNGKYQPITRYENSWAHVMEKERERTRREAEKDKRPTSIGFNGVVRLSNGVKAEYTWDGKI